MLRLPIKLLHEVKVFILVLLGIALMRFLQCFVEIFHFSGVIRVLMIRSVAETCLSSTYSMELLNGVA